MIVTTNRPAIYFPVEFKHYDADGNVITNEFTAHYKVVSEDEMKAVFEKSRDGDYNDSNVVKDHLIGWSKYTTEDGQPVPFSAEALDAFMATWPEAVSKTSAGFFKSRAGAVEKNS
jgi:hypothetical protein